MDWDFATMMVLAVVVTGVIWGLDSLLWKPKRDEAARAAREQGGNDEAIADITREPMLVEYARSFFPVILVVLVLRSFLVEPFRIPSGSMMPTLVDGDFILVNKYAYGIRLPVINTKIIDLGEPKRGDVVVFRYPKNPADDYIKRVIGLPGDTVRYYNKKLYINGEPMPQEFLHIYMEKGTSAYMMGANQLRESLGEVKHEILTVSNSPRIDDEFIVPDGHYFVMGDNRDNSNDSRVWGFVPDENLVGRAFMIWMNWDSALSRVSWERIGNMIK